MKTHIRLLICIAFLLVGVSIAYNSMMYQPLTSTISSIEQAMRSNNVFDDGLSKYMPKEVFDHLNIDKRYLDAQGKTQIAKKDITLECNFALHNFKHGHLWLTYSYQGYDKDGNLMFGVKDAPIEFDVTYEDGVWLIVSMSEKA